MRLIDVSALKEWVENWFTKNRFYHPYTKNNNIPITELYDILEQMPSVQPERPKGSWIPQNNNKVNGMTSTTVYYYPKCSVCGHCGNYTNFCPECGADMRG